MTNVQMNVVVDKLFDGYVPPVKWDPRSIQGYELEAQERFQGRRWVRTGRGSKGTELVEG